MQHTKPSDFIIRDEPERHDAEAVNRADQRLYAERKWVYPKLTHGFYRGLKWALLVVCLGIYYLVPWIRWDRGPELPNQAVLLDMTHNRFFMFELEIWPQEFYFVTGLLVLAALALFLVTSLFGRVWCGYFCPQTVWTDLMVAVERFWQGDRNARIRLDKEPWTLKKVFQKTMTHLSFLFISAATGGAFVYYFTDAPTLFWQFMTLSAPQEAYVFAGLFTATTYILGGIAREQVCIYMCPWPRIQGAMIDKNSFLVAYKTERGEPRGAFRKGTSWEGRGDCIDCKACVAVCPMGIDIRDGSQLECIQCALCVDACNDVMAKIGRPQGLVAYDTIARGEAVAALVKSGQATECEAGCACSTAVAENKVHLLRPRTLLYLGLIAIVGGIMLAAISNRSLVEANVIPDRNPFFVKLANGDIRNGYTLKVLNKLHEPRRYGISIEGLPSAKLTLADIADGAPPQILVPTDVLQEFRLFVSVPEAAVASLGSTHAPFVFIVRDLADSRTARRATTFRSAQ
ncbi:MAG: cytochrome c oxidase accessory protein CcoG [Hyphomicrobium sp.]|nr:cytochrome c oxidase accessory protein CcoG [Hyphomicrobium sp.]